MNVYAGLASVMIVLIFLYMLAAIFIYGAELNAAIMHARQNKRLTHMGEPSLLPLPIRMLAAPKNGKPMTRDATDRYNLQRFVDAQESVYERARAELKAGLKDSHWIWFIFPQIAGLGHSPTAKKYAIASREEARGLSRPSHSRAEAQRMYRDRQFDRRPHGAMTSSAIRTI